MPRPEKCRNVCNEPKCSCFLPIHNNSEEVLLQVDEYETLRLIDYENYSQEECGRYMNIARTTVQGIYERARKKLADVLVNGKKLIIEGGEYKLCEYRGNCDFCTKGCTKNKKTEGFKMRIAVSYNDGEVFQHFGHTEQFKFYDVENGKVINEELAIVYVEGHSAVAKFLLKKKADIVICGCIGDGAKKALYEQNMILYGGVTGKCDEVVQDFINGKLNYNPDVACSHHDGEDGEGCSCHQDGDNCDCGDEDCSCSSCGCH